MGSIVSLGIGKLEIDWGKNDHFINHSCLFTKSDRKIIDYYEFEGEKYQQWGYSRSLRDVRQRLDLLGYSLTGLEEKYNECVQSFPDYYPELNLSFKDFADVITHIDLSNIEFADENPDYDLGEYVKKVIFTQPEFSPLSKYIDTNDQDIATFFESFDPYIHLRLLAENTKNRDLLLEWRTQDIVDGGWVTEESLFEGVSDGDKFLVVTEGSSDAFVIEKAIKLIRPDIAEFFTYIDMQDHYPFSGTGNLYKFFQGLVSIKMQNKCLFIFDNDAEGIEKYRLAKEIDAPSNLKVIKLPDLPEFSSFPTVGPSGQQQADINGRAVAIECFLDLTFKSRKDPVVRWSSYKKSIDLYQGALEDKEHYIKQFKKITSLKDDYDFRKLHMLVDGVLEKCI